MTTYAEELTERWMARAKTAERRLAEAASILSDLAEGVGLADDFDPGYWGCPVCEGAAYQTGDPIEHKPDCKLVAWLGSKPSLTPEEGRE